MIKSSKKAEMGMGTLIIFIALVLVAAVAAAVLVSTTGSLQNKALATGKDTRKEVGTSVTVLQIYGEDGSNQSVTEMTEVVKLNSGSDAMRFGDLLLTLNLNNLSSDYTYDSSIRCSNTTTTIAGGDYGIQYSINGSSHKDGYLTKGDVARMCFQAPRYLREGESIRVNLFPKIGTPKIVETNLPPLMVNKRIEIYP